jgi:photosystem II stability/assembly factor-like uncharacterized protein
MRKDLQGSFCLRFSLPRLIVLVILISLSAMPLSTNSVYGQSIPTAGSFSYYLPLIITPEPTPVGPVGGTFTSFAIDPGQNDNIYAGHFGSGVYKTFDQGTTWYRKSLGLGNLIIQSLATHPTSSAIVFAGTYGGGIYRSTNGGESWHATNGGVLNNHIIYDIEVDVANPQRMFVVSRISSSLVGYLAKSLDGGLSWTILLTGNDFSTPDYFYDVDIDPGNPNIVYLAAHEHGFYKSLNGGASFYEINTGVTETQNSARSFAIDNAYAGLVYGGVWHGDGVYRTWNGGATWVRSSVGLPVGVRVTKVTLDPFGRQQKRVFSCTFGNGLYSSDDFAASWISRGLAGQEINDFVIADGNPQRWYAATQNNGIFRSSSYGSNWKSIMADLRLTAITGLAELPGEAEALAGAVYGQGVFRISGSGDEWDSMNQGLTSLDVDSLAVAGDRLYAIGREWMDVWDGAQWQAIELPEISLGCSEAAENWVRERVLLSDEACDNDTIRTLQPTSLFWKDDTLLIGTAGLGLWAREGSHWEQAALKDMTIVSMQQTPDGNVRMFACDEDGVCSNYQLDSENPSGVRVLETELTRLPEVMEKADWGKLMIAISKIDVCLFAVGDQNQVWVSADCGQNWTAHSFDWTVQALAFDPVDPSILIVVTRDSGAFKLQVP